MRAIKYGIETSIFNKQDANLQGMKNNAEKHMPHHIGEETSHKNLHNDPKKKRGEPKTKMCQWILIL